MTQLALPLGAPPADPDDAFIVSTSNEAAVRHFAAPGAWPVAATILTGPRKSGRSLLARIVAQRTGGSIADDADRWDEEALFHAWNDAQATRRPLVIVADAPPPAWRVTLPDLRSRLAATPQVALGAPDDALIAPLIERLLARRGLVTTADVAGYLAPRVERAHHAVIALVDALDMASLAARRPVTVPLARHVLATLDPLCGAA